MLRKGDCNPHRLSKSLESPQSRLHQLFECKEPDTAIALGKAHTSAFTTLKLAYCHYFADRDRYATSNPNCHQRRHQINQILINCSLFSTCLTKISLKFSHNLFWGKSRRKTNKHAHTRTATHYTLVLLRPPNFHHHRGG